jgi:predicted nucleotidyltransferase
MKTGLQIPHEEIRAFCRAHAVRELALFGSAARGDFSDASDVDVLIDLFPETRVGLVAFQRMRDELAAIFGRPVDLLTRDSLNRHIRADILKEATTIHAESTLACALVTPH